MLFRSTKRQDGQFATSGGRVLGITALGDTLDEALDKSYKAAEGIAFTGAYRRSDIGRIC